MAAGDAQRIWFPEMIEVLRSEWQPEMPFEALVALRDALEEMLQQIRAERHIRPPMVRCPQCGQMAEAADAHVSVRAMILALLRHEIAAPEPTYTLEKSWARYRKQKGLDTFGKAMDAAARGAGCGHRGKPARKPN
jgi:hypothetical protein